jgi:hypothetical protein
MSQVETVGRLPEVPAQPRRRRWRFWVGISLVLVILLLAAFYGFIIYESDLDLSEAMAEADRDCPAGWQLDALEAHREEIPDEENAALVVMKVKSLLPANWPMQLAPADLAEPEDDEDVPADERGAAWLQKLHDLSPKVQLSASLLRRLRASLAQAEPARAEARKLIGMTRGRFPVEWGEHLLEVKLQSHDARSAANLLGYEATLASQEGDPGAAVNFVRGVIGAARSVGDEPMLLSAMIRLAGDAQAVDALERALAQGEPPAQDLEAVQALLEKEAADAVFVQAARGERAIMHQTLLALRNGKLSLADLDGGRMGGLEKGLVNLSGPTLGRQSHAHYLRLMNEYIRAVQLPLEEQPAAIKTLQGKVIQAKVNYEIVTALLFPAILNVTNAHQRGVGNLRCAFVAVALERYRRDHGGWPDTLDALVPRYLDAVPKDPQDGKPLRYQRRSDGVVVYWLGHDGTDDGGKIDRFKYLTKGTDQGVELWDVSQRRQPAPKVLPPAAPEAP